MKPVVCLDIDGVLADFNHAFAQLIERLVGVPVDVRQPWPRRWNWADLLVGPQDLAMCWQWIEGHPEWWEGLRAYQVDWAQVNVLEMVATVYYVSTRPQSAYPSTGAWIEAKAYTAHPPLILCTDKPAVVRGLHPEAWLIDDKLEDVQGMGDRGILVLQPYNAHASQRLNVAMDTNAALRRMLDLIEEGRA